MGPSPNTGLSPRVRGNRRRPTRVWQRSGSIPACAGEPRPSPASRRTRTVYPRVCGGTARSSSRPCSPRGLSPRVRGNPLLSPNRLSSSGSIPACAGEPSEDVILIFSISVYPRVCGGTGGPPMMDELNTGLSPRVRGNRLVRGYRICHQRSIPACAGEPRIGTGGASQISVYPRVCGGTAWVPKSPVKTVGLSPRVRGNRVIPGGNGYSVRSIPACAGEPRQGAACAIAMKVYPRVCGGTEPIVDRRADLRGLSPRVRGNLVITHLRSLHHRSIPACAGEPVLSMDSKWPTTVYPRVCGGIQTLITVCIAWKRSIPACAGEPGICAVDVEAEAVYPRVCGGTTPIRARQPAGPGLSPRVRGNPEGQMDQQVYRRSIPACAGEPCRQTVHSKPNPVYPRVCGGTLSSSAMYSRFIGLSPRVRGNLFLDRSGQLRIGSIPACAGEPAASSSHRC